MRWWKAFFWGIAYACQVSCSGSDDNPPSPCTVEPLDPSVAHFGTTYAELAGKWAEWVLNSPRLPSCADDPVADATGELCAEDQDPASPVFFLAGTWQSGAVRRDRCVVPAGKALFFPLANTTGDTSPDPGTEPYPPDLIRDSIEANLDAMRSGIYSLTVDGCSANKLGHLFVGPAEWSSVVSEPPNYYWCRTSGQYTPPPATYQGYTAGTFVLLEPLSPGDHVVEFSAKIPSGNFALDITYDPLTVE